MFGGSAFAAAPFSSLGGNLFLVSVSETATVTDANASAPTYACFISDSGWGTAPYGSYGWGLSGYSASIYDAVIGAAPVTYRITMPEAATISDANSSLPIYSNIVNESVLASDSFADVVTFLSAIDEGAQALVIDYVAAATFVSFFSDTVTAEDLSVIAALFWELIATQQLASWQNIGAAQSAGWTLIDTEQNDTWQIIDTPTEV